MSEPRRGAVWWVDFGMAGKIRPAVVLSAPVSDTDYALFATLPHTTSERSSQHHVRIRVARLKDGAFDVQALAPLAKFVPRISTLSGAQLQMLDVAVKRWLCLD